MDSIVLGLLAVLIFGALLRRRKIVPIEVTLFLASIAFVYLTSRVFAFKLYVPNRTFAVSARVLFYLLLYNWILAPFSQGR